jgi:hypothetical protein
MTTPAPDPSTTAAERGVERVPRSEPQCIELAADASNPPGPQPGH